MVDIKEVVAFFGTQAHMARELGVSAAAVTQWVKAGAIPAQRAIQIEALSNGQIKALDLVLQAQ